MMMVSELIKELKDIQRKHGDINVELATYRLKPAYNSEYPWVETTAEFEVGHAPVSGVYVRDHHFSKMAVIRKEC